MAGGWTWHFVPGLYESSRWDGEASKPEAWVPGRVARCRQTRVALIKVRSRNTARRIPDEPEANSMSQATMAGSNSPVYAVSPVASETLKRKDHRAAPGSNTNKKIPMHRSLSRSKGLASQAMNPKIQIRTSDQKGSVPAFMGSQTSCHGHSWCESMEPIQTVFKLSCNGRIEGGWRQVHFAEATRTGDAAATFRRASLSPARSPRLVPPSE